MIQESRFEWDETGVMILKNLIVKVYEKVNTADIIPPISS
jgi:hypothetical protein